MRPWSTVIDLVIDFKYTARHMDINRELHGMSYAHLLGNLVWNHTARTRDSIWNHECDIRPKLHDMKFNYHFITAILKSQNLVSTNIYLI